ncbi:MAG: PHP domain-containing protein [Candidatus Helarchaeota archaeon]
MKSYNIDLHTHTNYSDGVHSINEAIKAAMNKNLEMLAITDHFTTSWKQSIIDTINFNNFQEYMEEIKLGRKKFQFKCLIGIEIDMESRWEDLIKIPFNEFELILFEYVDSIVTLKKIAELIQKLDIQSVTGLAHNFYYKIADIETFSKILIDNDIYFELNSRYMQVLDSELIGKLKELKDNGVRFTIGSDAHQLSRIGEVQQPINILKKIDGLENLIDLSQFKFLS